MDALIVFGMVTFVAVTAACAMLYAENKTRPDSDSDFTPEALSSIDGASPEAAASRAASDSN